MQPDYQPDTVVIGQSAPQVVVVPASIGGGMTVVQAGIGRPMNMMSFIDSIKTVLTNYVGFEGRASRSEYWWFFLATFIASIGLVITDGILFGFEYDDPAWLSWIFQLSILLPSLAVGVRRLHDLGKSGWYLLLGLIPLLGAIALLAWYCTEGDAVPNAYGPVPTNGHPPAGIVPLN